MKLDVSFGNVFVRNIRLVCFHRRLTVITNFSTIDYNGSVRNEMEIERSNLGVLFQENENRWIPRSVLMDLEPQCLDNIRTNRPIGRLFNPDSILCRKEGTGNNWAVGCYNEGPEIIESICERVRKDVEACDDFGGFQLFHSLSGGTGSGLGTLVIDKLKEEYPDSVMSTVSEVPSREASSNVVEPYNIVLTFYHAFECTDATIIFDNETIEDNITPTKKENELQGSFGEVNRVISKMISGITSCQRFPSRTSNYHTSDLYKIFANLVPFPRLHFFISSIYDHDFSSSNKHRNDEHPRTMINEVFNPRNIMCENSLMEKHKKKFKNVKGKHLTSYLSFQQAESPIEIEKQLERFKGENELLFPEWIPNSFHTGYSAQNTNEDRKFRATMISNSTTILPKLIKIGRKYSEMYRRKAYLHWFTGCGMDSCAFQTEESAFNDIISEIQQYDDAVVGDGDGDEDDDDEEEEEGEGEI